MSSMQEQTQRLCFIIKLQCAIGSDASYKDPLRRVENAPHMPSCLYNMDLRVDP